MCRLMFSMRFANFLANIVSNILSDVFSPMSGTLSMHIFGFCFVLFLVFLGLHQLHMEVPRLGVESALQCLLTPQP